MRLWLFVIFSAVLGIAAGTGFTWAEFASVKETFKDISPDLILDNGARVEVADGTTFNFGVMRRGEDREHTFQLKNVGTGELTLREGETSCSCTLSKLSKTRLQPGDTAEVTVKWTPKSYSHQFQQTAEVFTNDPAKPVVELMIQGMVTQTLRPTPDRFVLTGLNPNSSSQTFTRLYSYRDEPFTVTSAEFMYPDTKDLFSVDIRDLTAEELQLETGAHHGVMISLEVAPGLPLGPVRQSLKVTTSYDDVDPLEIDVQGDVQGDLSISGTSKFSSKSSTLNFGRIDRNTGESANLFLLAKGEFAKDLEITGVETDPETHIAVDLKEPERLSNGSSMIRFTVRILPGKDPVNHLGTQQAPSGRILLKTTHPQTPDVPLYVRFVTE